MLKTAYPASLNIDYPDRKLNRLTSFFRAFTMIPIFVILILLTTYNFEWGHQVGKWTPIYFGGMLFLPLLLMILFRKKYPRWWFDWNLALTRLSYRVGAYFGLIRDEYPSTDEEQSVHLDLAYPDAQSQLARGMPLVKWILAIPHYVILFFLAWAAIVCIVIAWFAILFTGRYPKGLFEFVVGVMRWGLRVWAYAFLLISDKYPPFSLEV